MRYDFSAQILEQLENLRIAKERDTDEARNEILKRFSDSLKPQPLRVGGGVTKSMQLLMDAMDKVDREYARTQSEVARLLRKTPDGSSKPKPKPLTDEQKVKFEERRKKKILDQAWALFEHSIT